MRHSLCSFTFFIKERKRTLRTFWFHKSYKNDKSVTGTRNPRTLCIIYPCIVCVENPQRVLTCRNLSIRINKVSLLATFTLVTTLRTCSQATTTMMKDPRGKSTSPGEVAGTVTRAPTSGSSSSGSLYRHLLELRQPPSSMWHQPR